MCIVTSVCLLFVQHNHKLPSFLCARKNPSFSIDISGSCPLYLQIYCLFPSKFINASFAPYSRERYWIENKYTVLFISRAAY